MPKDKTEQHILKELWDGALFVFADEMRSGEKEVLMYQMNISKEEGEKKFYYRHINDSGDKVRYFSKEQLDKKVCLISRMYTTLTYR